MCLGWMRACDGVCRLTKCFRKKRGKKEKYILQAKKKKKTKSSSTQGWQRIWLNEDKCLWTISNKIRSLTSLV